jgi:hypothetical protein
MKVKFTGSPGASTAMRLQHRVPSVRSVQIAMPLNKKSTSGEKNLSSISTGKHNSLACHRSDDDDDPAYCEGDHCQRKFFPLAQPRSLPKRTRQ